MRTINIGLVGCGVVGSGVVRVLADTARHLEQRLGIKLVLKKVADRDPTRKRAVKIDPAIIVTDGLLIANDPEIDIVIELIGGTTTAGTIIKTALKNGKHVVTANKALLAEKGEELFALAESHSVSLLFEAAVAGAIPVIRTLRTALAGETLDSIYGILNGTCNYILTKMSREGVDFGVALTEAQAAGFAESDPTLDVGGGDTAHKLALLAMLAWGVRVPFSALHVEGITKLSAHDFTFARRLNRVIKLIAIGKRDKAGIELRVHPTLIPATSPLAKIDRELNATLLRGPHVRELLLSGYGAGSLPTASAVVGDIVEAARAIASGCPPLPPRGAVPTALIDIPIRPIGDVESEYYLRFMVRDCPGVIRDLSTILANHQLSIRDILQLDLKEFEKETPLVVILHRARESTVRAAIAEIDALPVVHGKTVVLRVEE